MRMTEGRRDGGFLLSEANGSLSREAIMVAQSATFYEPGSVLALVAGTAAATQVTGAGKGVLTLADPAVGPGVKPGAYRVIVIEPAANGGSFQVEDPDGVVIGTGVVGTAFDGVVKFTIADGTTDFFAGDMAIVTVTPTRYALAANADAASAILYAGVNAAAGHTRAAAIVRLAEVKRDELVFAADVDSAAKVQAKHDQLARSFIIAR